MKLLLKTFVAATLGCLFIQMCGCASTSMVNVWSDPSFQAQPLGKMLIIAVSNDATKRRIWEDAFAGELAKHAVATTASYSLFPQDTPDTTQVVAAVKANGFDGILVILRLPSEMNMKYIEGYTTTERHLRYSSYWQRYVTYYRETEYPGYVDAQTVDIRAIDVTTTGDDGRLVWSATSRTPEPGSVLDVQREIAGLVISDLVQRAIISSKK